MMTPAPLHRQATETIPAGYGRVALATAMVALGIYLLTIAPDLTWANASPDGVELITASATLGIPHPPGYPTYVVLGKLFSLLPMGTVAFRYNLFSALAASMTVGLVALIIGILHAQVRPVTAAAAALLFGFAPLVWSQALVAEIYPLNLLLLALFLLAWNGNGASIWIGIWLGLAITTHPTSLFFLPLLLISRGRRVGRPMIGTLVGLSPLLLLPILAAGDSPIVWGRPADLAGWWWLVSGQLYAANFRPAIDWTHGGELLRALALGPSLMVTTGNITGLVDELVAEGLIERLPDPTNRRASLAAMTAKGRKAFGAAAKANEAWIAEMFAGLDAVDKAAMFEMLGRQKADIAARLRDAGAPETKSTNTPKGGKR